MVVRASIIDDQSTNVETETSISYSLEDGIILIDIPLEGEDVPPPYFQLMQESKDEANGSNNKTN